MRFQVILALDMTFTYKEYGCQGCHTCAGMYNDAAGEVNDAKLSQESAAPYPVAQGSINKDAPEHKEHEVTLKINPVRKGAGYQRRSQDRKHLLITEIGKERDRLAVSGIRIHSHRVQETVFGASDNSADIRSESHGKSENKPDDSYNAHGYKALHHNRQNVFLVNKAAVEERDARRHNKYQGCTYHHKGSITVIDHFFSLLSMILSQLLYIV